MRNYAAVLIILFTLYSQIAECQKTCSAAMTSDVDPVHLPEAKVWKGRELPLTLSPSKENADSGHLMDYISKNKNSLLQQAVTHGAVLLRGWNASKEDFADAFEGLELQKFPYVGGAAPRHMVVRDVVYTTNESPPSEPIPFHHEMAQVPNPPNYVAFYCEREPSEGGETPIILSRAVAEYFERTYPEFYDKVLQMGVRYVRTMPLENDNSSAIGRSWKSTFGVETKEEAEEVMTRLGTTWKWLENGDCRTTTATVPALRSEPRLGNMRTFFNAIVAAYTGWVDSRNDPTKSILLGDGTPLTERQGAALLDIQRFQMEQRTVFKWRVGDILIIDNRLVMHSRNPFKNDKSRRILAAIGGAPLYLQEREERDEQHMLTLRSGDRMPSLGYGVWKVQKDATANSVYEALRAGYRHIDAACDYGNEKEVGEGIARAFREGWLTRKDIWVTSKLWNTYHKREHVEMAARKSLEDLQIDYFDLYLIHFPISLRFVPFQTRYPPEWIYDPSADVPKMEHANVPVIETWRAMERLVENGMTRNIGVANFNVQGVRDILSYARIPPSVLQVELHPYNTQSKLVRFCRDEGIVVTGFSPLGAGSYQQLGWTTESDSVLNNKVVTDIANSHDITSAQVVLRWAIQRGTSAVVKTSSFQRMKENLNALTWGTLSDEEMSAIDSLNQGRRFNDPGVFTEGMGSFYPIYE